MPSFAPGEQGDILQELRLIVGCSRRLLGHGGAVHISHVLNY